MLPLLAAVLSASVLGSLHCAGMCGPFCAFAVNKGSSRTPSWLLHSAYHGGRLVTYTLVGIIAGVTGALIDVASTLAGFQPIALATAGGMMILFGIIEFIKHHSSSTTLLKKLHWYPPKRWALLIQKGQRFATKLDALPRALTIGLLTTLLPCGWLYAFVVTAAGAGSPMWGGAVMATFWLGTLPVMLSLGIGARTLMGTFGKKLPTVTAMALVVVGVFTLSGRLNLQPETLAAVVQEESIGKEVPSSEELPACCRSREESADVLND